MPNIYQAYIDGRFIGGSANETFPSINPATEDEIAQIALCTDDDVDRAVSAARSAFEGGWRNTSTKDRSDLLSKIAHGIRAHTDELARIETADSGKPISDNLTADVPETAACFDYFADAATRLISERHQVPFGNFDSQSLREPVGVVAAIAPWNYPLVNAAWKLAPALAAGNCVVYKPAEDTCLSTLKLAEIMHEVGLPAGVVNIVTGPGDPTGTSLVSHPGVDKVSFTGSTKTGQSVLHAAADNITGCMLELGGKSPNIVFDDCDIDKAIPGALFAAFVNAGQVCTAGSRLLIHAAIYEQFVDRFIEQTNKICVGDPTDAATKMGPLVSRRHMEHVAGFINRGKQDGAHLLTEGTVPSHLSKGFYLMPTVFTDVSPDSDLDQHEVFGPVVSIYRFNDEDEAIRIANASPYGLAAGVWTRDEIRAHRMATRIEAGTIWINTFHIVTSEIPFSGFKQSGIGTELGMEGLKEYTRSKNICTDLGNEPLDYFL